MKSLSTKNAHLQPISFNQLLRISDYLHLPTVIWVAPVLKVQTTQLLKWQMSISPRLKLISWPLPFTHYMVRDYSFAHLQIWMKILQSIYIWFHGMNNIWSRSEWKMETTGISWMTSLKEYKDKSNERDDNDFHMTAACQHLSCLLWNVTKSRISYAQLEDEFMQEHFLINYDSNIINLCRFYKWIKVSRSIYRYKML